jgi:hypothetical protein
MTFRNLGYVLCLLGVLAMVSGRFMVGAPPWLVYVGVSVIVFGWGLFAVSILQRRAAARADANPTSGS